MESDSSVLNNDEALDQVFDDEIGNMVNVDMEDFSKLMTDQERESIKQDHQAEILKLKEEYEARIAELSNPDLERLRQIHAAEIAALKEESMAKQAGPSSRNYGDFEHNCDRETLARMKANYEEQLKILSQENTLLKERHGIEMLELKKHYEGQIAIGNQDIEMLKLTNTVAIQTLKEDHQKEILANKKKAWVCF